MAARAQLEQIRKALPGGQLPPGMAGPGGPLARPGGPPDDGQDRQTGQYL
jgi:hypothetical protein